MFIVQVDSKKKNISILNKRGKKETPVVEFNFSTQDNETHMITRKLDAKINLRANQIKHNLTHVIVNSTAQKSPIGTRINKLGKQFLEKSFRSLSELDKAIRAIEVADDSNGIAV